MNINIKLKPLVIAMALALSACGSSGGSDSDGEGGENGGDDNSSTPVALTTTTPGVSVNADNIATTTLKGIVADGYISGATVCLDVNENSVCDTNEPTTTSAAGGAYNLSDISASDAEHSLIAVVDTNATDADGRTFPKKVIFSAPKGAGAVISPLSTLVHHKLKTGTADIQQAKQAVISELGLTLNPSELLGDYVAQEISEQQGANNETKYRDTHRAAQLLTTLIGDELALAKDAATTQTNSPTTENMVFDNVMKILQTKTTPENPETFISKVKMTLEMEKENVNADFTRKTKQDLGLKDDGRYENSGVNGNESSEMNGNESSEMNGNESSEMNGNESSEMNGNESSEVNGNESSEMNENESSEVNGNESSEMNENESSEMNENESSEMNENESNEREGQNENENGTNTGTTPVATTPVNPPVTLTPVNTAAGKTVYDSRRGCSSSNCHGANPATGQNKIKSATSPAIIKRAIANNTGGMGVLSVVNLTDQELQDIVNYVANP